MKKINLALQGGGAHGAYTWGVLNRLLEEEDLEIEAISGTSAGAMNAAVLVTGYCQGGREKAKELLHDFWQEISLLGSVFNPNRKSTVANINGHWNLDWSLSYNYFELLTHMLSPYQLNPLNINPLKWVLEKIINIEELQRSESIKLFITATAVRTGQPRVFKCQEITTNVLLASACIPYLFQAIVIDDEPYWDGGYMGNPVIWPLIYYSDSPDIMLVQVNPLRRHETPVSAHEIMNRLNEITFNSSLISEMRAINFVSKLVHENRLDPQRYKDIHMHMITGGENMANYNASSKLNSSWQFFWHLKEIGYHAADEWLKNYKKAIGEKSSIDIQQVFLSKN